jgi:hypothetical protein
MTPHYSPLSVWPPSSSPYISLTRLDASLCASSSPGARNLLPRIGDTLRRFVLVREAPQARCRIALLSSPSSVCCSLRLRQFLRGLAADRPSTLTYLGPILDHTTTSLRKPTERSRVGYRPGQRLQQHYLLVADRRTSDQFSDVSDAS